jgi:hypothetical protein
VVKNLHKLGFMLGGNETPNKRRKMEMSCSERESCFLQHLNDFPHSAREFQGTLPRLCKSTAFCPMLFHLLLRLLLAASDGSLFVIRQARVWLEEWYIFH